MSITHSIILGIIQGLTEFLPVSSSGHLIFIPKLFGWTDQGLVFDVVIHLGTLAAVVVYFRKRLKRLLYGIYAYKAGRSDNKLALFIILSIMPAGIIGLFVGDFIEANFRSALIVGAGLIFWGIILAAADGFAKGLAEKKADHPLEKINWKQALFISCAQIIALVPGTSRSGITMAAGLFSGFDKKGAAEFSFLMSIPIIFLAGILKITELFRGGFGDLALAGLTAGFAASLMSGFAAIWGLMRIIQKWSFMPFVVYRVVVGVIILVWLA